MNFSFFVSLLRSLLERCLKGAPVRSKKYAKRILLSDVGWDSSHEEAFNSLIDAIRNTTILAFPNPDLIPCLFTDASLSFWSIVITQIPKDDLSLLFCDQKHQPLAFSSGEFKGASFRWSIPEKEAYPIYYAVQSFDYLLCSDTHPFHIYTDHKNLVFMFNPSKAESRLKRHSLDKIYRWRLVLDGKKYIIESIPGSENVWADITTRWAVPRSTVPVRIASIQLRTCGDGNPEIVPGLVQPLMRPDFEWPKIDDIIASQQKYYSSDSFSAESVSFTLSDSIYKTSEGIIWVPDEDFLLQYRLLVIAHAGCAGHRAIQATLNALNSRFIWKGMSKDVDKFCKLCLHCTVNSGGEVVPRPFGEAVHGSTANSVLHFDYLFVSPSNSKFKYLLVIRCDLSSFIDLFPCESPTAAHAAESLLEWFSRYGVAPVWVSDRGSHFLNEVIRILAQRLHASHHFTLAYCPWANGSIEIINKHILSVLRSLTSEL